MNFCPLCSRLLSWARLMLPGSFFLRGVFIVICLSNLCPQNFAEGSVTVTGKTWWKLYHTLLPALKEEPLMNFRPLFTKRQWRQFDGFHPDTRRHRGAVNKNLLEAAVIGLKMAITECKYQFTKERWNCSILPASLAKDKTILGNLINRGVPESAFFHAILSASVTQAVSEACLSRVEHCPCSKKGRENKPQENFQWRGCDHNVHYGKKFARRLLDSADSGSHIRHFVNKHNNRLGRIFVSGNMKPHCRCHGTSGACNLKTCYRKTPRLREIGNYLKKKYTQVVRVMRGNNIPQNLNYRAQWNSHDQSYYRNKKNRRRRRRKQKPNIFKPPKKETEKIEPPSKWDLVYYEALPSDIYCDGNSEYDTIGTMGRKCNSTSLGPDHCSRLCCGRGHKTEKFWTYDPCHCEFQWCCKVVCKKCEVLKTLETCK